MVVQNKGNRQRGQRGAVQSKTINTDPSSQLHISDRLISQKKTRNRHIHNFDWCN